MHTNENGFSWYINLKEAKDDGYSPVHVTSFLCFFRLKGRTNVINVDNLETIPNLKYLYLGRQDEDKPPVYYVKDFRSEWGLDELWFYKDWDVAAGVFRNRCKNGDVWVLFTAEQVAEMSAMLSRVYKAQFREEAKLDYKLWLELAEFAIKLDDYRETGKNLTGYKTALKLFDQEMLSIWAKAKPLKK
jgi:hypothetical protein